MLPSKMPDADRSRWSPAVPPFFTVLIPTMNRPQLLEAAVKTVLWQTFKDFELIVSDNSSDEASISQNRVTIERYTNDPRVQYIRPTMWMNMPDHWEFASRHASGRYVVILTDRHVMRPSALEFLRSQITRLQDDGLVISWHCDSTFYASGVVLTSPFTGVTEVTESPKMVSDYAKLGNWRSAPLWVNHLPRMLNSCYRSDVAQTIREKHGRLFMPLSPDYTAAYLLLAYTHRIAYLDRPLFMNHGSESNGKKGLVYGDEEYISSLGDVDLFAGTPALLRTTTNSLIRDLLMVRGLVGAKYADVTLDLVGYYMCNYRELLHMQRLGSLRNVRALYAQWWESVRRLTREQQNQIKAHVNELEKQRAPFTDLRRLVVWLGLDSFYHSIVDAIRQIRHRLAGKPVYVNVLEAAMQTDYMISSDWQAQ